MVVLIALGESIIAIGVGAGLQLVTGVIVGAALGIVVVSALWWLYFDVAAIFARMRLAQASGVERARLARDAYSYLDLPMVAGIVFLAFGLETTLHHLHSALDLIPAVALCAGVARTRCVPPRDDRPHLPAADGRRGPAPLPHPVAVAIPALAALALVSGVCSLVVAYEAIRYRENRARVRHPEPVA